MTNGRWSAITSVVALALLVGTAAIAGNKVAKPSDTPPYDANAEYVVNGTVTAVNTHDSVMGYKDTHFIIATTVGDMEVHVAPVAYLAQRGFAVKPGDKVVVTGCKTTYEDKTVLVARQIKSGDLSVTVRNSRGKPVWPKNIRS
jgi:phosphoenolpyruvate synthase/pyruvate phosphate dikinase